VPAGSLVVAAFFLASFLVLLPAPTGVSLARLVGGGGVNGSVGSGLSGVGAPTAEQAPTAGQASMMDQAPASDSSPGAYVRWSLDSVGSALRDYRSSLAELRSAAQSMHVSQQAQPAPASVRPAPSPAPPVQATPVQASNAVPSEGEATAFGCGPALAYLHAYAMPGFQLTCPGSAQGHQATTCYGGSTGAYPCGPYQKMIVIADPCPAAYMNEAHNSWVIMGYGSGIDPYGYCRS
jgi:hypothetical protein